MVSTLIGAANLSAGGTASEFWHICGCIDRDSVENDVEIRFRSAGTLSGFHTLVFENTINATKTYRTRKNNANGGQSVSVGSLTTGIFEDTTGSDSSDGNDDFCIQTSSAGTSGTFRFEAWFDFDATTNTVSKLACDSGPTFFSGTTYSGASTTYYNVINGFQDSIRTTTGGEDDVEIEIRKAGTWKNFSVKVNDNSRASTTTGRTRINNSNGNQSVSISGLATGLFEDISNTDSILVGDDINYALSTGTGTSDIGINSIYSEYETTSEIGICVSGDTESFSSTNAAETEHIAIRGWPNSPDSETTRVRTRLTRARKFSNMTFNIDVNTTDGTSTARFRINQANGNQVLSIAENTTGMFTDSSNADDALDNDIVNFQITGGSGVGTIKYGIISVYTEEAGAPPVTIQVSDTVTVSDSVSANFIPAEEAGPTGDTDVKKFTFLKSTSTSTPVTQVIPDIGFQAKALWLFCVATTNNDAYHDGHSISYGFSDGATDACIAQASVDDAGTSSVGGVIRDDSVICILDPADPTNIIARASVTSFNADGTITLSWAVNNTQGYIIHGYAIGGDDITNVKVINTTTGTESGVESYTGVGFQGDFANFIAAVDQVTINTPSTRNLMTIGAAKSSTEQWTMGTHSQDAQGTSDTYMVYQNDKCLASWDPGNGDMEMEADFRSFDADGLTLDYVLGPLESTQRIAFIVVKGGLWDVGDFAANNTVNNQVISLDAGIDPQGIMVFSTKSTVADTGATSAASNNSLMIGGADNELNQGLVWLEDVDTEGTTVSARISKTDALIRTASAASTASSSTTLGEADINDMSTTAQITIDWTDAIDHRFAWFAVGRVPVTVISVQDTVIQSDSVSATRIPGTTLIQVEDTINISDSVSTTFTSGTVTVTVEDNILVKDEISTTFTEGGLFIKPISSVIVLSEKLKIKYIPKPPASDRFGIAHLYKTLPGGWVWEDNWEDISSQSVDLSTIIGDEEPIATDPDFHIHEGAVGTADFDGAGHLTINNNNTTAGVQLRVYDTENLEAIDPLTTGLRWDPNIELTVYVNHVEGDHGFSSPALDFINSTSSFVSIETTPKLDLAAVTISAWIRFRTIPENFARIFDHHVGGTPGAGYLLALRTTGETYFEVRTAEAALGLDSNTILSANTWYHIIAWYDSAAGTRGIAINGVDDITTSPGGGTDILPLNGASYIGSKAGSANIDGQIDSVKVFDKALSSEQRSALYNNSENITDGIVASWEFDEGSGTVANEPINNLDGTIEADATWTTRDVGFPTNELAGSFSMRLGSDHHFPNIATCPYNAHEYVFVCLRNGAIYIGGEPYHGMGSSSRPNVNWGLKPTQFKIWKKLFPASLGNLPTGTKIGWKFVKKLTEDSTAVTLEIWRDLTDGNSGGQWQKLTEFTHRQGNWFDEEKQTHFDTSIAGSAECVITPTHPDQPHNHSGGMCYLRLGIYKQTILERFSIREIDPIQTSGGMASTAGVKSPDFAWFFSGGSTNRDPSKSLGGVISQTRIPSDIEHNLFDAVTERQAALGSGSEPYHDIRCIYLKNISSSRTLINPVVFFNQLDSFVRMALSGAGINAVEPQLTGEEDELPGTTPPPGTQEPPPEPPPRQVLVFEKGIGADSLRLSPQNDEEFKSAPVAGHYIIHAGSPIINQIIIKASFFFDKVGNPQGTAFCRVWDRNDRVKATLGSVDVTTITTQVAPGEKGGATQEIEFGGDTNITYDPITIDDKIGIEHFDGTDDEYIRIGVHVNEGDAIGMPVRQLPIGETKWRDVATHPLASGKLWAAIPPCFKSSPSPIDPSPPGQIGTGVHVGSNLGPGDHIGIWLERTIPINTAHSDRVTHEIAVGGSDNAPGPILPPPGPTPPPPQQGDTDQNGIVYLFALAPGGQERFDFDENFRSDGKRFDFEGIIGQPGMEIGGYFRINNNASDEVSGKVYGGIHTDDNPEFARPYDIGLNFEGDRVRLRQEHEHGDYTGNLESESLNLGEFNGRWVGFRFLCFNINNNTEVRMVTLVDNDGLDSNDRPTNNWQVVADWTDSGQYPNGPYTEYPFDEDVAQQTVRVDEVGGGNDLDWFGVFFRHIDPTKPLTNIVS